MKGGLQARPSCVPPLLKTTRRPPPRRGLIWSTLAALALAGCRSGPAPVRSAQVLRDEWLKITVVEPGAGPRVVEFRGQLDPDHDELVARLRGVRLVTAASGRPRSQLLPFVTSELLAEDNRLVLSCGDRGEHAIRAEIELAEPGEARVEVRDDIGLRTRLFELTLDYDFEAGGQGCDEHLSPHPHEARDELAGDLAFHAPIGYLRAGKRALGLSPDLAALGRERRIPHGIEVRDGASPIVRHGLIAHRVEQDARGRTRFTRSGAEPVEVRAESLEFAHYIRVFANAERHRTLTQLHSAMWQRTVAPSLALGAPPAERSWDELERTAVDRVAAAAWRDLSGIVGITSGCFSSGRARLEDGSATTADSWFQVERQALRTAFASLAYDARNGRPGAARAVRQVSLALAAPRRGGMIPSCFALDTENKQHWLVNAEDAEFENHFHALDAACTGIWLLELANRLPALAAEIDVATGELARFFVQNQRASGSIPSFYDAEFLQPRRDVFDDESPETGAAALFLCDYARRSGDANARRAAIAAVEFLGRLARETDVFADFETLALDGATPSTVPRARGSLGLIFAARAAFATAALTGQSRHVEIGTELCERLATRQHVWTQSWQPGVDPRGGIRANDLTLTYDDPRQALAADAWLRGYAATGRREFLQRGALALRAGLRRSTAADGEEDVNWGRSTAAAIAERTRETLGQGVVDIAGRFAEGLDAVWFEALSIDSNRCSFRLLSQVEFDRPVRIVFRGIEPGSAPMQIEVNGSLAGEWSASELEQGVDLTPLRVPELEFLPPGEIRQGAIWTPEPRYRGTPMPVDARSWIEYRPVADGGVPGTIALEPGLGGTLTAVGLEEIRFDVGTVLEAQLVVQYGDGRRTIEPPRAPRLIRVGTMDCLDVGDDGDPTMIGGSDTPVTRYSDGRQNARRIDPGQRVTYRIPIDATATELEVELHLEGSARVTTGAHLLHADEPTHRERRTVSLRIADPRLWRDARALPLTIATVGSSSCNLARIRYLAKGNASPISDVFETDKRRAADARIRIHVLPMSFQDTALRATRASLDRVFFGGEEYRQTPEPQAQMTSGSVASLVARMSGGISELRGTVLPPFTAQASVAAADGEDFAQTVVDELRDAMPRLSDGTACVIVYAGDTVPSLAAFDDGDISGVPLIFVPEQSPDGSVLASGTALLALLDRLYDLEDLGTKASGNFGRFSLSAGDGGHVPNDLAGVNLVETGWADVSRVPRRALDGGRIVVGVPPLQRGRHVLELPFELPDRGSLFVETRMASSPEPWRGGASGSLVYWRFAPGAGPHIVGTGARSTMLRLAPGRTAWETPFSEATSAADLFSTGGQLDANSRPSIATPRGDVVWSIHRFGTTAPDGSAQLTLEYLADDLIRTGSGAWRTGRDGEFSPLLDATTQARGHVDAIETGYAVRAHAEPSGIVRGIFSIPASSTPQRVIGRIAEIAGTGTNLVVRVDDEVHVRYPLAGGDTVDFQVDLDPAERPRALVVDFVRAERADWNGVLEQLVVLPRALPRLPISLPESTSGQARLADGIVYGRAHRIDLDRDGHASLSVPIIVPKGGAALRAHVGFAHDADDGNVRMTAKIGEHRFVDSFDITKQGARTPLHLLIARLPDDLTAGFQILDVELQGAAHAAVYVESLAIDQ